MSEQNLDGTKLTIRGIRSLDAFSRLGKAISFNLLQALVGCLNKIKKCPKRCVSPDALSDRVADLGLAQGQVYCASKSGWPCFWRKHDEIE